MAKETSKQVTVNLTGAEFGLISAFLNLVQKYDLLRTWNESSISSRPQTIGMSQTQFVDMILNSYFKDESSYDACVRINYSKRTTLVNSDKLLGKNKSFKISDSSALNLNKMRERIFSARVTLDSTSKESVILPSEGELIIGLILAWLLNSRPELFEDRGDYFYACLPAVEGFSNNDWLVFSLLAEYFPANLQDYSASNINFAFLMWKTVDAKDSDGSDEGKQTQEKE